MKRKINIEYLKEGDLVAIGFVAKHIKMEMCNNAIAHLKSAGFNLFPVEPKVFKRSGMFSGKEEDRTAYLQALLDDVNIRAIFFARGGFGSIKIIDKLKMDSFYKKPKWLIGFSDITTIFSHINSRLYTPVIHAPMIYNFPTSSKRSLSMLFSGLKGAIKNIKIKSYYLNRSGLVESEIIGGNLSILCSLLGSNSFPVVENKILFLEDVDEYMYSIDRMFSSLRRANVFNKLSGLIIGQFTNISDNKPSYGCSLEQLIYNYIKDYNFPVCFNFPSGHVKNNLPIFFQKRVKLKIDETVELEYKDDKYV